MMNKILLLIFSLSVSILTSYTQQNDGGTPMSFHKQYDQHNTGPLLQMPSFNVDELRAQDAANADRKDIPFRFAYNHFVNLTPTNSGAWYELQNGKIWMLRIQSQGANSLNFGFEQVNFPAGAKMFIYNKNKSAVLGAFTSNQFYAGNMLSTDLLGGDEVTIEYFIPNGVEIGNHFKIYRVSHGYRELPDIAKAFGGSGSCNNNVNCPVGANYQDIKRSVVCLVSGGSEFCTGALVNNTANDGKPYILTANHCVSGSVTAWVSRFNWEAPACANPVSNPASVSVSGASLVANRAGSDFALLLIGNGTASAIPSNYNVFYAGWDRNNVAAPSAVAIHHPSGDIKKISFTQTPNSSATWSGADCWKTGTWTDGVTEPGSSGSPLFNPDKRIVGQLYGGPSSCQWENNATNGFDYYGKFSTSWDAGTTPATRLKEWLDPGNTGVTTLDGYDPNVPAVALDAGINSIISPNGTYCDGNNISASAILKSSGSTPLVTCRIYYKLDNNAAAYIDWNGTLTNGQTQTVNLPAINTGAGNHTFKVWTSNPNNSTDQFAGNDTANASFTVINATGAALPIVQGFEGSFPPANWTIVNNENAAWVQTNYGGFGTSSKSMGVDNFDLNNSTAGNIDDAISGFFDLSQASTATLKFDVAHARYSASYIDSLIVLASSNCGGTWTRIYNKGGTTLATAPDATTEFIPTASQWRTETVDLTSLAGNSSVQIMFRSKSGWGNWIYVDNINITAPDFSQPPTASFSTSASTICSGNSISITNTSQNAASYEWSFPGGNPSTSTNPNPTVTYAAAGTYTITLTATNQSGSTVATQNITVNATPSTPVLGSNSPICAENALNLNSNTIAGATYLWAGPSGFSSNLEDPGIANASTANSGTYTCYAIANGCTSTIANINVTVYPLPNPDITQTGNVLSTTTFVSYQWYLNGAPISGATNQNYTFTQNGSYTVEVTDQNGCKNMSKATLIENFSLENQDINNLVSLFPNPSGEELNYQISLSGNQAVEIIIYDLVGKLLIKNQLAAETTFGKINLNGLSAGVYVVKIQKGSQQVSKRIVKK
jgi:PKD repeat protein